MYIMFARYAVKVLTQIFIVISVAISRLDRKFTPIAFSSWLFVDILSFWNSSVLNFITKTGYRKNMKDNNTGWETNCETVWCILTYTCIITSYLQG